MCQGQLRLVDAVPITEEFDLKCHHTAFVQTVIFECQVLVPHPFISNPEYGKLIPCPEHGDRQMLQLAVVATGDQGNPDMTRIGDRILNACNAAQTGHDGHDTCPTCTPIEEAEAGFYNDPDGFLAARQIRCPACDQGDEEGQVAHDPQ